MEWKEFPYGWALLQISPDYEGSQAYAWIRIERWMVRSYPNGHFPQRWQPLPPDMNLEEAKKYVEVMQRMSNA